VIGERPLNAAGVEIHEQCSKGETKETGPAEIDADAKDSNGEEADSSNPTPSGDAIGQEQRENDTRGIEHRLEGKGACPEDGHRAQDAVDRGGDKSGVPGSIEMSFRFFERGDSHAVTFLR